TNVSGTQTATDRRSARESHQPAAEKRPDFLRSGELGLGAWTGKSKAFGMMGALILPGPAATKDLTAEDAEGAENGRRRGNVPKTGASRAAKTDGVGLSPRSLRSLQ
ncbi:MAG: hypothetical protein ACYTKD_25345, partial [Planctomycetota bacterium]